MQYADLPYNFDLVPLRVTVHSMRPLGSDWGANTVASLPKFWIPLCHERSVGYVSDVSVNQVYLNKLTNLKVVLVGQRIVDSLNLGNSGKNLVAHLVHGSLNTGAVVLGEDLHCDIPRCLPRSIEVNAFSLGRILEQLPFPTGLDVSAQNTVPRLRKLGVFVTVETVEGRSSALEHQQLLNLGTNRDALALSCDRLDNAKLLTVTVERVWVWLAIDVDAGPSVLDDLDVGGMDMWVCRNEVVTDNGSELLRRINWMLLGKNIGGLLLGVGCNDNRVICLGVTAEC
jgi:hypothetical protein